MPATHLVYRHGERTTHNNLKVGEEPVPIVAEHEVLIQVRGVTLNYRDLAISNSSYPFPVKADVVPCSDAAGVVTTVGAAVDGLKVGDRVVINFDLSNLYGPQKDWVHSLGGWFDGVLREYVSVPAEAVVKIPDDSKLSDVQLASLVCTGVTAWNVLYGSIPLRPGQTVLFQGTGGVSITGLQLAKAAGAVTIITSSSDDKLKFVQERFGADHVINYRTTPNWAAEALKITHGKGVDYIFENGGSGTIGQSIEAVAQGGIIGVIGFLSAAKQEDMPDVASLVLAKGCTVRGIVVGSKQLLEEVVRFVCSKDIHPYVHETFGFSREEVVAAFDYLNLGRHIGKIGINVASDK